MLYKAAYMLNTCSGSMQGQTLQSAGDSQIFYHQVVETELIIRMKETKKKLHHFRR